MLVGGFDLPAQQLRQQRVAQGGEGAGFNAVGDELVDELRHGARHGF